MNVLPPCGNLSPFWKFLCASGNNIYLAVLFNLILCRVSTQRKSENLVWTHQSKEADMWARPIICLEKPIVWIHVANSLELEKAFNPSIKNDHRTLPAARCPTPHQVVSTCVWRKYCSSIIQSHGLQLCLWLQHIIHIPLWEAAKYYLANFFPLRGYHPTALQLLVSMAQR